MKKLQNLSTLSIRIFALCVISFLTGVAKAQDQGIDIDVNLDEGKDWYQNPIAWVVGAAVFILLLVALLRSGKKGA